ncbi:hypothetical protein HYT24_01775 [Candidatus Pacearchaeota archaeon]|nr:hypothetical protein [Candidatus Pacearchaeota archaeon]
MKNKGLFLFSLICLGVLLVNSAFVLADSHNPTSSGAELEVQSDSQDDTEFEEGVELEVSGGITPDSGFYFVESGILEKFRDDIENREKKVAEIKAMVQEGKIDEARVALGRYKTHADNFEKEVSPEERDEARRSASAIHNTLREIESEIPEEDRGEFVDDVIEGEKRIITAAEIASKIKELCENLAKLDPSEYARVCKSEDDAPDWHKKLDRDLTDEQRAEAEKFGRIMGQCFETSGQECKCEEIPFAEFAEMCSIAAPLVVACDIEGNEEACEEMDNLEMPELPPHLQDVMDKLEGDVSESRLDAHMPSECRKAGATSPKECMKIMIQTHAPPECKDELIKANVQNERQAREICEKIMFEQNAPQECIDAGLTNHKECGKFMFQSNAPQECIDAGITGEGRNDPRKCEQLMRSQGFEGGPGTGKPGFGPPSGFGGNCRSIQDTRARLACYDGATQGVKSFDERFKETKQAEMQCAQSCRAEGGAWDFSGGECRCHFDNFKEEFRERNQDQFREDFRREEFNNQQPPQGFVPPEGFIPPEGFVPPEGEFQQPPQGEFTQPPSGEFSSPGTTTESSGSSTTSTSSGESSGTVTGQIIAENKFFDYYYR